MVRVSIWIPFWPCRKYSCNETHNEQLCVEIQIYRPGLRYCRRYDNQFLCVQIRYFPES